MIRNSIPPDQFVIPSPVVAAMRAYPVTHDRTLLAEAIRERLTFEQQERLARTLNASAYDEGHLVETRMPEGKAFTDIIADTLDEVGMDIGKVLFKTMRNIGWVGVTGTLPVNRLTERLGLFKDYFPGEVLEFKIGGQTRRLISPLGIEQFRHFDFERAIELQDAAPQQNGPKR